MKLPVYQINAFASGAFAGNPAIVCPLERWLDDATMQKIAAENGLTCAFLVGKAGRYRLRWFAPAAEIEGICGHGTLAAAFVAANALDDTSDTLAFEVAMGTLRAERRDDGFLLDLPSLPPKPVPHPADLERLFGTRPVETAGALDFIAVFETERDVAAFDPDLEALLDLPLRAAIVTAPGDEADFVSRWFCPRHGEGEDTGFTGSAHCSLVPYWAARLGRTELQAKQLSPRGTTLTCELRGDRVLLHCAAAKYMEGWIYL